MSTVSFNQVTATSFIDQLVPAFHEGDPDSASKATEAGNVRRLQEHYRAIARGDFEPVIAGMALDIEMEMIGPPGLPLVGRWRGRQQVAEAVRSNFALLEDQQAELLAVVAQGDTVVLFAKEQGRYRPTGKTYAMHWTQLFRFDDGQIISVRGLYDTAAMLEAVRSSESYRGND